MNKAVIAIGSNSTRMYVKSGENELKRREDTRLMLGISPDGMISPGAMHTVAMAVLRLKSEARLFGAEQIHLFATSAAREAKNAEEFADELRRVAGMELSIISGEEEARCAFIAASGGKHCAVLDIGGGSTEITVGANNQIEKALSTKLGASRLMQQIGKIGSIQEAEIGIENARCNLQSSFADILALPIPPALTVIGGTATTLAAMHLKTISHGDELEGTVIPLDAARDTLLMLAPMAEEDRGQIIGLHQTRAAIMPHGLCILCAAMELFGYDKMTVSVRNNLDALIDIV